MVTVLSPVALLPGWAGYYHGSGVPTCLVEFTAGSVDGSGGPAALGALGRRTLAEEHSGRQGTRRSDALQ